MTIADGDPSRKPFSDSNPLDSLLSKLADVQPSGTDQWTAKCPAHQDRHASLSIGRDGDKILLHCHAGCATEKVVKAVGLDMSDLFLDDSKHDRKGRDKKQRYATAHKAAASYHLGEPSQRWPYHDADGSTVGHILRWDTPDGKVIRPVSRDGDGWVAAGMPEPRPLYRLPELAEAQRVYVTEGEKAADAARDLGLTATTSPHGAKSASKANWSPLAGKEVIILPDNDEAGRDYAQDVANILAKLDPPPVVKRVNLKNLPDGGDIYDWIARGRQHGKTKTELRDCLERLANEAPAVDTSQQAAAHKPVIIVTTEESHVVDAALAALATSDQVYQRGGFLVQVVTDAEPPPGIVRPKNAPRIATIRNPRLRELLSQTADFVTVGSKGPPKSVHPPDWVVSAIVARASWPSIRRIEAVTETPLLRRDGTVLEHSGYDSDTGILYWPCCEYPPIPDQPTKLDAEAARDQLFEVVEDFPFATEAHKATWLAAVLTPFARFMYDGCTPLFTIDANVRASGKGLLADCAITIATGREPARTTAPKCDEECRKRITSIALSGDPVVLLDNISGALNLPSLDAALTGTSWNDRILGCSEMTGRLPLYCVWLATGNNILLEADTARRMAHIRLQSPLEKPELRQDFKHPYLLRWVRRQRPELAVAALTILRAYFVAGKPDMNLPAWGSFEQWSRIVRNAVVWCGLPDPADTREELMSRADRGLSELRGLIEGWRELDPEGQGISVAQALKMLDEFPGEYNTLRNVLLEMSTAGPGRMPSARSIAMKLHHQRRRIINGKMFDSIEGRAGARWFVRDAEGGTSGSKTQGGLTAVEGLFPADRGGSDLREPAGTEESSPRLTQNSPSTPVSTPEDTRQATDSSPSSPTDIDSERIRQRRLERRRRRRR